MSGSFPTVALSSIADLNPQLHGSPGSTEVVSFLPMAAVEAEVTTAVDREARQYAEVGKGYTPFMRGDVLLAKITPCFENGKIAHAQIRHRFGFGSTEFHVVRPRPDRADARYLVHFLRQDAVRRQGENRMTGSGGQRRVPEHFLANLKVPIPRLSEQQRIAAILDKADALRAKRRAALAKLDTLTQSIFLDMFGDPASNPKKWRMGTLADCIKSASDGPHVSPKYSAFGVPILSTRHVRAGEVLWEDLKFIDQTEAETQWRKCKPQRGDVLYTKGGTTGLAATVTTDEPFAVWVHVALLRPDFSAVESKWLEAMLNNADCYRQSQELTRGIANRDLGLTRMVNIKLFIPPRELQREYVARMGRVEGLRARFRASVAELDALFASLQHRAFRGEL